MIRFSLLRPCARAFVRPARRCVPASAAGSAPLVGRGQGFRHRGGFKRVGQAGKVAGFGGGICSVPARRPRSRSPGRSASTTRGCCLVCGNPSLEQTDAGQESWLWGFKKKKKNGRALEQNTRRTCCWMLTLVLGLHSQNYLCFYSSFTLEDFFIYCQYHCATLSQIFRLFQLGNTAWVHDRTKRQSRLHHKKGYHCTIIDQQKQQPALSTGQVVQDPLID